MARRLATTPTVRVRRGFVGVWQRWATWLLGLVVLIMAGGGGASAHDRVVSFFPLPAQTTERAITPATVPARLASDIGRVANDGMSSTNGGAWGAYAQLWSAHHANPADPAIRRFLGLPAQRAVEPTVRRGRSAPSWLGWRSGSYSELETPHFSIYSQAPATFSRAVAEDAERFYWIWTQLFFPFWEGSSAFEQAWKAASATSTTDAEPRALTAQLAGQPPLPRTRPRMRIVIFRNATQYQRMLGKDQPGVAVSTGFYSDERQTTCLFASTPADRATRHHEFTHQLFREASLSRLGRQSPGEERDFWLVEGIAGYMESLAILDQLATVGGWDAERLQYARYRILMGGDAMPIEELRPEGRRAVQERADLARWYAHAIAQTHRLLDGEEAGTRDWVFGQLATLYRMDHEIAAAPEPVRDPRRLERFLTVDDALLRRNVPAIPLKKLCLTRCEVTAEGLGTIPPSDQISWLDLSRLPIALADVQRLCVNPLSLTSLNLEATRIDATAVAWLSQAAHLQELDLSWTRVDDSLAEILPQLRELETVWLTGTAVSDEVIAALIALPKLRTVDLQRTGVTEAGLTRLRTARPSMELNPLEIR